MKLLLLFLTIAQALFGSFAIPKKPIDWDNWNYSEKVIWRGKNLDPRIPYEILVDKLKVKEIVQNSIPVAKTLYATDDPSTIFIENLPSSFMMKANNASGRGLFVKDGMVLARYKRDEYFVPIPATNEVLRAYAKEWLNDTYADGVEKQYALVKPMILFEEYLASLIMNITVYCFYGEIQLIRVFFLTEYKEHCVVSLYDSNWKLIEADIPGDIVRNEQTDKPKWLDGILTYTKKLSQNIDHVRVDYFIDNDTVYFGEFTFNPGGNGKGIMPDSHQSMFGKHWKYPEENLKNFGLVEGVDRFTLKHKVPFNPLRKKRYYFTLQNS